MFCLWALNFEVFVKALIIDAKWSKIHSDNFGLLDLPYKFYIYIFFPKTEHLLKPQSRQKKKPNIETSIFKYIFPFSLPKTDFLDRFLFLNQTAIERYSGASFERNSYKVFFSYSALRIDEIC